MTGEVEIRPPLASEHEALRAFLCDNGWAHRIPDAEWLGRLLAGSRSLVAVQGGAIVGFGRAVTDGLSNAYLSMVAVAPACRRQGIGSRLVRELMAGADGVTWVLRASRPGAREFFAQLGFSTSADAMERPRQA